MIGKVEECKGSLELTYIEVFFKARARGRWAWCWLRSEIESEEGRR